jgi:hypothetical protein
MSWFRRNRFPLVPRESGTWYCTAHNGVGNEDDSECDFAWSRGHNDEPGPCERNDLFYWAKP